MNKKHNDMQNIVILLGSSLLKAMILMNMDAPSTIANKEVHYSLT
jgi:hypothetical protein